MTTQTLSNTSTTHDKTPFLRRVLQVNTGIVATAGLALIAFAPQLTDLLASTLIDASTMTTVLRVMGIGFLPVAALVLYTAQTLNKRLAWIITAADIGWPLLSFILLLTNALGLSTEGNWLLLIQADIVLLFGIMEWVGISRAKTTGL
jgi:hypothetical protein